MSRISDSHLPPARENEDMTATVTLQGSDNATDTVLVVVRHHPDPAVLAVPGLASRTVELGADLVTQMADLYEEGVRHITLPEVVDLSDAADPPPGRRDSGRAA